MNLKRSNLLLGIGVIILSGCIQNPPVCKFKEGQMVTVKILDKPGMVTTVSANNANCYYGVRYVSSHGTIEAAIMREYEIETVK